MTEQSIINNYQVYTIVSPDGRTKASFVPEKGGVGCSIIMPHNGKPRELLYLHDNFWENDELDLAGGWPFLFPICGRLDSEKYQQSLREKMRCEAKASEEAEFIKINEHSERAFNKADRFSRKFWPIHGFAPYMPWEVLQADQSDSLVLELNETEETLKIYPFKFKVQLTYRVENNKLICEQVYTNMDKKPLPYYAGFHPYFLVLNKQQTILNYHPIKRFKYNSSLTEIIGEQELFKLPTSVDNPEINEQLTEVTKNDLITLQYPDGFKLSMQTVDEKHLFRYVQLYTMPEKPFFCIEPWMSFPGALNTERGARILQPGCSERSKLLVWCE